MLFGRLPSAPHGSVTATRCCEEAIALVRKSRPSRSRRLEARRASGLTRREVALQLRRDAPHPTSRATAFARGRAEPSPGAPRSPASGWSRPTRSAAPIGPVKTALSLTPPCSAPTTSSRCSPPLHNPPEVRRPAIGSPLRVDELREQLFPAVVGHRRAFSIRAHHRVTYSLES